MTADCTRDVGVLSLNLNIPMRFIATSLVSSSQLVESLASDCIMFGRHSSFIDTNALLCCDMNWSLSVVTDL